MQFTTPAEHYDRFMGRYVPTLATAFADAVGVTPGMRVVDVGCGPGGLARELSTRVGASSVAAIDPAAQFVHACRERNPGADVREGKAESLPWPDGEFDAALSSLVVAFMTDADQGVREMARVTRRAGTVAACMWDIAGGGMTMLSLFWTAVRRVAPEAHGEQDRPGTAEGDLSRLFLRAGLGNIEDGLLEARAEYTDFDDFWIPFTLGVGPAGRFLASLPADAQIEIREACRAELPEGSFSLSAHAWYAKGTVPADPR